MNILMKIEYDGTNYSGWQYQPNKNTIQGELEKALNRLFQERVKVTGASRTDAGVSAQGQIANFRIASLRFKNLQDLFNSLKGVLPNDIYVKRLKIIDEDFNARYSSKGKIYLYQILANRSPLKQRFAWVVPYKLDLGKMRKVTKLFLKQKNYRAFCKVKDKDGKVKMKSISIRKTKDEIHIKIEANRYLYKMVRRIIGALVDLGRGHRTEEDVQKALIGEKHRPLICAPANGLILKKVIY